MQGRLAFVSLLFGVLLGSACARPEYADLADASVGGASRETAAAVVAGAGTAGAPVVIDRYAEMSGRKTTTGSAFVQNTPDLWAPFDVSVQTGFFDAAQMASPNGVRVCLEIDDVGFDVFYLACGQYSTVLGGWQTFAGTNLGNLAGSANVLADEIELRVEQSATDVNFYSRARGALTWNLIDTTAFPAQSVPFKPSFGVTSITKGTAVGFDGLLLSFSAPPVAPTGADAVAFDVNLALRDSWDAYRALDAGVGDFATAANELSGADDALDGAQLGLAGLPVTKDNQTAAKLVTKAQKGILKAQDQVTDQDAAKALKTLEKLGRNLVEASLLLDPQPFPPPPI